MASYLPAPGYRRAMLIAPGIVANVCVTGMGLLMLLVTLYPFERETGRVGTGMRAGPATE